jgi:hypothetical protein
VSQEEVTHPESAHSSTPIKTPLGTPQAPDAEFSAFALGAVFLCWQQQNFHLPHQCQSSGSDGGGKAAQKRAPPASMSKIAREFAQVHTFTPARAAGRPVRTPATDARDARRRVVTVDDGCVQEKQTQRKNHEYLRVHLRI